MTRKPHAGSYHLRWPEEGSQEGSQSIKSTKEPLPTCVRCGHLQIEHAYSRESCFAGPCSCTRFMNKDLAEALVLAAVSEERERIAKIVEEEAEKSEELVAAVLNNIADRIRTDT